MSGLTCQQIVQVNYLDARNASRVRIHRQKPKSLGVRIGCGLSPMRLNSRQPTRTIGSPPRKHGLQLGLLGHKLFSLRPCPDAPSPLVCRGALSFGRLMKLPVDERGPEIRCHAWGPAAPEACRLERRWPSVEKSITIYRG